MIEHLICASEEDFEHPSPIIMRTKTAIAWSTSVGRDKGNGNGHT